jgi:dihydroorotase (multifunctional complex type)
MQEDLTFTDLLLWNEDRFEPGKLALSSRYIEKLGDFHGIVGREVKGHGLHVMPALVDNHVHFREPGAEAKEDFRSGSAAAAHGGACMVLEVQNSMPLLTNPERVEAKRRLVREKSCVKVGLYASAVKETLEHMNRMAQLTSGLKLFMAPSHGDEGLHSEELMRPYFQKAAELGFHLIVHAEDGGVIKKMVKKHGALTAQNFSKVRPPLAEIMAVERALKLAGEYGTRLHVFHLTTAGATDLIVDARARGVDVTCSTCPHYLFFTDEDVAERGGLLKCFPSIKGPADRERLLDALRENEIEIVSTDHAPHLPEEKELDFAAIPAGISSADLLLPLLTTLVARGELTFADVVRLTVTNPASIHRTLTAERLSEGSAADLVFFDPAQEWEVRREDLLSRANRSPYVGMKLTGRVAMTLVDGACAYHDEAGPLSALPAS